jgi:hypothetical protein
MITESDIDEPINLGSSELVTINQLVDTAEDIAGIKLKRTYDLNAPKGVNGRNSDNTLILEALGWSLQLGCVTVWSEPTAGSNMRSQPAQRGISRCRRLRAIIELFWA